MNSTGGAALLTTTQPPLANMLPTMAAFGNSAALKQRLLNGGTGLIAKPKFEYDPTAAKLLHPNAIPLPPINPNPITTNFHYRSPHILSTTNLTGGAAGAINAGTQKNDAADEDDDHDQGDQYDDVEDNDNDDHGTADVDGGDVVMVASNERSTGIASASAAPTALSPRSICSTSSSNSVCSTRASPTFYSCTKVPNYLLYSLSLTVLLCSD